MTYTTLIDTGRLAEHLEDPGWLIVDCRFSLVDTGRGRQDYLVGHIPGAIYAHLDEDLSGLKLPGKTGRHPLPEIDEAGLRFSRMGIGEGIQVVAYDDAGGALAAVRLWWMLHWLGHEPVAVLNGGWQKWVAEGHPVRPGEQLRPPKKFAATAHPEKFVTTEEVERLRLDPNWRLLDARAADRFRGENETIDPVAGHIPGAVSAPYAENLTPEGTFQTPEALKQRYQAILGGIPIECTVVYCGSGVTSTHNLLAMQYAGLGEARLYAGSWSEWITDPGRPVAR